MAACSRCGEHNPPSANFCLACGAPLARAAPAPPSARKTVTVLFCDVAESTRLGERLDPESLRRVMSRWFESMRAVLERHGGTVEKFIGDAVMAVFGVPRLHEDDALRAARAAVDMRAALAELNVELERDWNFRLQMRIGVNTGEVVAGDPAGGQTLVTGDAVNLAKRLEQAARSGEILIGGTTKRLVENAVLVEPRDPLPVKGKSEQVESWCVLAVITGAAAFARRLDSRLVGRREELARLQQELATAEAERTCRLVTVLGPAGIGKSRLAAELAAVAADEATVLTARCLPYGDGITFWPLTQLLRDVGGDDGLLAALAHEPDGELVAERVRGAIGEGSAAGSSEETFWAVRRLLEALARGRPLILCLEDIHWAQPTFLDLIEYVAGWSRDAPILLLCLARPELLDDRPAWLAAEPAVLLNPLSEEEAEALLDELAAEWPLSPSARRQIMEAAEGNPLFVEQLVAMLAEETLDGSAPAIPPTIQALLSARLDRLAAPERAALERASVFGKEFTRGAMAELSPESERAGLGPALLSLVRKDLIQPDHTSVLGDDGFRFRHVLIRDAAYAGIPKEVRADLHERAAAWIDRAGADDELLGYHLECAYRYREQLGPPDARARALGARAGELLGRAGQRAFAREDMPAAINLLDRALALGDGAVDRLEMLRDLSNALWASGESARANEALAELAEQAAAAGDVRLGSYARLEQALRRDATDPHASSEEFLQVTEEAIKVFSRLGDDLGLARAWRYRSYVSRRRCRFADAEVESERALLHAQAAGDPNEEARSADSLCTALLFGPAEASRAIRRGEELIAGSRSNLLLHASVDSSLSALYSLHGDFERARMLYRRSAATYDDLGLLLPLAALTQISGVVELLAGDPVAAEREFRRGYEIVSAAGVQTDLAAQAALLSFALLAADRHDEARPLAEQARRLVSAEHPIAWVVAATALARSRARDGDLAAAEREARGAVETAAGTDALNLRAEALMALAVVLDARGAAAEADDRRREALRLYRQKGNVVSAELAARRLGTPAL